jgi:hypothetical protein
MKQTSVGNKRADFAEDGEHGNVCLARRRGGAHEEVEPLLALADGRHHLGLDAVQLRLKGDKGIRLTSVRNFETHLREMLKK